MITTASKELIDSINNHYNGNICLIAASKTRTIQEIEDAKKCGIKHFGENYIQEAEGKKSAFDGSTLHMIGRIQSNKAKQAVTLFDVIHTVTSKKLADKLNKYCLELNKHIDVFIQVNIANEPQKNGVPIQDLAILIENIKQLSNLNLIGLMIIPPKNENPVKYFKLANTLIRKYNLSYLSMGMSSDYKEAIKNGATHIRIGTTIFGARK